MGAHDQDTEFLGRALLAMVRKLKGELGSLEAIADANPDRWEGRNIVPELARANSPQDRVPQEVQELNLPD